MTRKRSRLEMYLDVLETMESGINKPTNIMYKCNLSWVPMQEILDSMIEKNLIAEVERGRKKTYEVTERGRDLLRYLQSMVDVLASRRPKVTAITSARTKSTFVTQLGRDILATPQAGKSAENDAS